MTMDKLSKIWTASVAYVALVLGAGLSITFNVVDVMDVRGDAVDRWDIVTAVAFPALVVLMVELFVSRLWLGRPWPMQVIRWAGTVAIGGIAMRVSWVHGHDFFLSRGQAEDVANLAPLAIDLLAIMATALILSGRGDKAPSVQEDTAEDILAKRQEDVDKLEARTATVLPADVLAVDIPVARAEDTQDLSSVRAELDKAITEAGHDVANEAESWLAGLASRVQDSTSTPAVPVSPAPAQDARPARVRLTMEQQDEAYSLAVTGRANGLKAGEIAELLAGWYSVSSRTIRRQEWWTGVTSDIS